MPMRKLLPLLPLAAAVAVPAQDALPVNTPLVTPETLGRIARSTLTAPATTFWQGEVFPLTHTLTVEKRYYQSMGGSFALGAGPVNAEDWPQPKVTEEGGRMVFRHSTRAYATQGGSVRVPAGVIPLVLVSRISAGAFGSQPEADTFTVTSNSPQLTFRPLPAPAPVAFAGAIGEFSLSSTLSAPAARVGEAITWTVRVAGTGNWPEIRTLPARVVSRDFDYVKPVQKLSLKPDTLFDGELREELLLVPTKAGSYRLGPVRFVYFNPKVGKYQQLTSETIELAVGPRTSADGAVTPAGASGERVRVPEAPPVLPLDPLGGLNEGPAPRRLAGIALACTIAPLLLIGYWLWLAAARRWQTDALRPRREAQARLRAIVDRLAGSAPADAPELREAFFAWQQAAAAFAGVAATTPTPAQVAAAINTQVPGSGEAWADLWREANRVIFGKAASVPPGWADRARAALAAAPVPRAPLADLFRTRNLLPAVALVTLTLALAPALRADPGTEAYRAGDFPAAEQAWAAAAAKRPLDANLRYNLSLAAAQQDRWAVAAAQALAAFCLDPGSSAIRWQFQLSLDRAGIDHPFLADLAHGTGLGRVARLHSPAAWGWIAIGASVVFALAVAVLTRAAFRGRRPAWRSLALGVAALALPGMVTALVCLHGYGELADRDIAVVAQSTLLASVPTEADTGQKTSPLPAGSLARVEEQFLTWSRLRFSNGQTGWVRTKLIVFPYRSPLSVSD